MKKIISVLLSAVLLSLLLTGCEPDGGESSAPESGAVSASTSSEPTASGEESAPAESPLDDFEFAENDTGITVVKYLGDDKDVVIPAQVNGKPVTVIGECSFEKMNIFSVTLPDTVTVIGEGAFGQCKELKNIDLPDSVTELQGGAFRESGLETITWSDNLQTIGYSCFANTNLREVMLPNQLTELLSGVFMECDNLEKVIFNEGLKLIEGYCFAGAGLKEIVLSSTVTELQEMSLRAQKDLLPLPGTDTKQRFGDYCIAVKSSYLSLIFYAMNMQCRGAMLRGFLLFSHNYVFQSPFLFFVATHIL